MHDVISPGHCVVQKPCPLNEFEEKGTDQEMRGHVQVTWGTGTKELRLWWAEDPNFQVSFTTLQLPLASSHSL